MGMDIGGTFADLDASVRIAVGALLAAAAWTDLRYLRIPNKLTVLFALGGILHHGFAEGLQGTIASTAGVLAGFVPLYLMFRFGGIGGGDVKLFGAIGTWFGPLPTLQLLLGSIAAGGGIALLLLALRLPVLRAVGRAVVWPWGEHPLDAGGGAKFPFMLAVAPVYATMLAL